MRCQSSFLARWLLGDQRTEYNTGTPAPSSDHVAAAVIVVCCCHSDNGSRRVSQQPLTHRKGNLLGEPAAEVDLFHQIDLDV